MAENWHYVGMGFYVVRSQAGFKQAVRAWLAGQEERFRDHEFDPYDANFPSVFPAAVRFGWRYTGTERITVGTMHVDELRANIANMAKEINVIDPSPDEAGKR